MAEPRRGSALLHLRPHSGSEGLSGVATSRPYWVGAGHARLATPLLHLFAACSRVRRGAPLQSADAMTVARGEVCRACRRQASQILAMQERAEADVRPGDAALVAARARVSALHRAWYEALEAYNVLMAAAAREA